MKQGNCSNSERILQLTLKYEVFNQFVFLKLENLQCAKNVCMSFVVALFWYFCNVRPCSLSLP